MILRNHIKYQLNEFGHIPYNKWYYKASTPYTLSLLLPYLHPTELCSHNIRRNMFAITEQLTVKICNEHSINENIQYAHFINWAISEPIKKETYVLSYNLTCADKLNNYRKNIVYMPIIEDKYIVKNRNNEMKALKTFDSMLHTISLV